MSILLLLIPISLIFVGIALWAFLWAVNHDQFDDLDRAAHSILFDDDLPNRIADRDAPAGVAGSAREPDARDAEGADARADAPKDDTRGHRAGS